MGKAHTHEVFMGKVESLFGKDEYTILGRYINCDTKVLVKHNLCGYEWDVRPQNFLTLQSKCPNCSKKIKYADGLFKEKVYKLVGDEYDVLNDCTNCVSIVTMKHNVCGFEWSLIAHSFINEQSRCPLCAGLATYTTERFKEKVFELEGINYTVNGEYINTNTEIEMLHTTCKNIFLITPQSFMHTKTRCPFCFIPNEGSFGEVKIKNYLEENNFLYKRGYTFQKCRNINVLPFDFAVFDNKWNLKLLIEFDGGQHYKPVGRFGGISTFEGVQARDEIKNKYCKDNNIRLLRIPFYEIHNIPDVLEKEFKILKIKSNPITSVNIVKSTSKRKNDILNYEDNKVIELKQECLVDDWHEELLASNFFYARN